jgi:hypothetical protein
MPACRARALVARGERNEHYVRLALLFFDNDEWGLMQALGEQDILRRLTSRRFQRYSVNTGRPEVIGAPTDRGF